MNNNNIINHSESEPTMFTNNDIGVYLMLAIATIMYVSKINQYLYSLFLIIGIILGIISIIEKLKKKK